MSHPENVSIRAKVTGLRAPIRSPRHAAAWIAGRIITGKTDHRPSAPLAAIADIPSRDDLADSPTCRPIRAAVVGRHIADSPASRYVCHCPESSYLIERPDAIRKAEIQNREQADPRSPCRDPLNNPGIRWLAVWPEQPVSNGPRRKVKNIGQCLPSHVWDACPALPVDRHGDLAGGVAHWRLCRGRGFAAAGGGARCSSQPARSGRALR